MVGEELDLSVPQIQNYVTNLNNSANSYWESMIKSTTSDRKMIWSDCSMNTDNVANVNEYSTTATYMVQLYMKVLLRFSMCSLIPNGNFLTVIMLSIFL